MREREYCLLSLLSLEALRFLGDLTIQNTVSRRRQHKLSVKQMLTPNFEMGLKNRRYSEDRKHPSSDGLKATASTL